MSNATCKAIYIGGTDGKAKKIYPAAGPRTMTARFDLSNSDPSQWGEYLDDAVNMTAGSAEWDAFFGHYPAMIKNGAIVGELDPSQGYAKYTDGTTADITSGADGDVMIVFPRRGLKIWTDSGYLYVSITEKENQTGYEYYAHTYKGNACDWFALGRYKGYYDGSKLRSLSGKTPSANITIGNFRTYAQAGGAGYEQSAFFQLTYRQAMYMLKYLGQNAQSAVGRGYSDGNSTTTATGGTNALGMDYGENTGKVQMSLFGIEDFYGNLYEWTDGVYADSNRQLSVADGNYNDSATGYTSAGTTQFGSNIAGIMKDVNGTNIAGFTPASQSYGSVTTYFCDYSNIYPDRVATFGGYWAYGDYNGVFQFSAGKISTDTDTYRGSRLMYMHTAA